MQQVEGTWSWRIGDTDHQGECCQIRMILNGFAMKRSNKRECSFRGCFRLIFAILFVSVFRVLRQKFNK